MATKQPTRNTSARKSKITTPTAAICLVLESVNDGPIVEYRALVGHPAPFSATVERRQRAPVPDAEWTDWAPVTAGAIAEQLRLDGPVSAWLREVVAPSEVDVAALGTMPRDWPAYVPLMDGELRALAQAHLDGLEPRGWRPGDGLSDADLGLGHGWSCPDGITPDMASAAVRALARELTDEDGEDEPAPEQAAHVALTREQAEAIVPTTTIRWLCNRIHIGTGDAEVAAEFRDRFSRCDPEYREAAIRCALRCHAANRQLYRDVVWGTRAEVSGEADPDAEQNAAAAARHAAEEAHAQRPEVISAAQVEHDEEMLRADGLEPDALEVVEVAETAGLWCRYPGQTSPQPAFVELDPAAGILRADWNGEIGGAVPMQVWHRLALRWPIPLLRASSANALLHDLAPLASRVRAGWSRRWDGSNHVGRLDEDAEDAATEIGSRCDAAVGDLIVWRTADWLLAGHTALEASRDLGVSAWTTDEDLAVRAEKLRAQATGDGIDVLDGDLVEALEEIRQACRDDVEDDRTTPGVLCRADDGAELGPATDAQANASADAGPEGMILVDLRTGEVVEDQDADRSVVTRCFVTEGA